MLTTTTLKKALLGLCVGALLTSFDGSAAAAGATDYTKGTHIVFLGTGTPIPDPRTQGPSLAVIVNGMTYIVDAGVGLVRRAAEAQSRGVAPLGVDNLKTAFITHLHSDHTLGLPDLIYTPWIFGRKAALELYAPAGTKDMVSYIEQAWSEDIDARITGGEGGNPTGYKVNVHELQPGVVYQDANVKVTAFKVSHINWKNAFGFRFDTADNKSIVISGDRRDAASDQVEQICNGCDYLVHEVFSGDGLLETVYSTAKFPKTAEQWHKYMMASHTQAEDLSRIATRAKAKNLVLHHQIFLGPSNEADMVERIKKGYSGKVISAHDLDVVD
jgi:ribonuclease BN (tRNA processing enzyme)